MTTFSSILFHTIPHHSLKELNACEKNSILEVHQDLFKGRKKEQPQIMINRTQCTNPGEERTTVHIVFDDKPFLVDSIVAEINRHALLIDFLIHPYIYVDCDPETGKLSNPSNKETDKTIRQAHLYIRLHRLIPKSLEQVLYRGLRRAMVDVTLATGDWQKMRSNLLTAQDNLQQNAAKSLENKEYAEFLDYLYNDNYTLLGYRYFALEKKKFAVQPRKNLGLLRTKRDIDFLLKQEDELPELFSKLAGKKKSLNVFKINRESSVHRRVPIDAVSIQDFDPKGHVKGFHLFIGLFTSVTYSRSVMNIPYLRMKVQKVIDKAQFPEDSHDDKALRHVLEKYPRDELFQISVAKLHDISLSILSLQERQRIALFVRPDIFGKSVSCLIYIPRNRFETRMRRKFEKVLEKYLGGETAAYYTTLDDSVFARIILLINSDKKTIANLDEGHLEELLRLEGRAWDEELAEVVNIKYGEDADPIIESYTNAFPTAYRETYEPVKALNDIEIMDSLAKDQHISVSFYHDKFCKEKEVRLKLFIRDEPVILSDVLPILKNMGLRVISELPFRVDVERIDGNEVIWIHDFLMESDAADLETRIPVIKAIAETAFEKIWHGKMNSDTLNKLVISAAMTWREIKILRTYVHYIRQLGSTYSQPYIANALTLHPEVARLLVDIFYARLDPSKEKESEKYARACSLVIQDELEEVSSLDEDRILRSILNLVEATIRTNYFQTDQDGNPKDYLSIKIDSSKVENMPEPVPFREIFVYSPRVEGIHLRGGPIARGGLRWSDRQEDYRTEVLGLMKAQMVKNAVIVPTGSKGGFVLKHPPKDGGREALQAEAIECYKIFIRGLLDITDNRKGTKIIPPKDTVRRDGDDPYLVVAADKGTATFSDIANGLSREYGFWLDDAFASGGSAGYDHKKMGITARGAWESVMRHFYELNHDIQTQEFDVIGVGDMAGDVFGNGMLLSKKIRLIGAFNHLHIFCDPDPDPETTWKERKRLFDHVKGWDAYNTELLSKGGRIYLRSEKVLHLTPEIQARFQIDKDKVSPFELMHAMLKTKTDLLWFGGIGTYIKATNETDAQVGDKANDAIRVSAPDVHAKVIGEGANLAVTQLARIEFAKNGGSVNADFIDNSGGVDSSDHEVNIKILLKTVMEDKSSKMTIPSRNKLLESMTETVAQHVLNNNRTQAEAISLMELQGTEKLSLHADLITQFENDFGLKRKLEGLPDQETINTRLRMGKSLTRPEISTLQAYAKIDLMNTLMETSITDHASLVPWLISYFPHQLQTKYKDEIKKHRLGREIICMKLANNIVNRMGPAFVKNMRDQTGAGSEEIIRAYLIAKDIIDLKDLWLTISHQDLEVLAYVKLRALRDLSKLTQDLTLWFLKHKINDLNINKQVELYGMSLKEIRKDMPRILPEKLARVIEDKKENLLSDGFPEHIADFLSQSSLLGASTDIIRIATESPRKPALKLVTTTYFRIEELFGFSWLYYKAGHIDAEDKWNAQAKKSQMEQLARIQASLCEEIINDLCKKNKQDREISEKDIIHWAKARGEHYNNLHILLTQLRRAGTFDLAMLTLAANSLQAICDK